MSAARPPEGARAAAAAAGTPGSAAPTSRLPRPLADTLVQALAERFGSRWTTAAAVRAHHGHDESRFAVEGPQGVVYAHSNDDVADLVRLCRAHRTPLIPFGAGTSVEGQVLALHGGISLDLSQMSQVLAIHAEDLAATVQAGVTRKQLNEALKSTGLFFPIDPGADATLGGMCATRASGTNAVRYGTMRENVLGMSVVTSDGDIQRPLNRARKSAAGYDMKSLYIGSEGTLGVITEVTVRLYPVPEAMSAAVCGFTSLHAAIAVVIQAIQLGVPLARCEYVCPASIRMINAYSKSSLPVAHALFFEFHGSAAHAREQAETVEAIADAHGGTGFEWATRPEDRTRLWQARHTALYAVLASQPGARAVVTDTCVPISRLADAIAAAAAVLERSALTTNIVGHVGDGNFHCGILVDPGDAAQVAEAERLNAAIVEIAQSMEGTCTGEHGIGLHKMDFLQTEAGAVGMAQMRRIKQALDPDNIFNPGKMLLP